MKFIVAVLALAISCEALYPPAEPIAPVVVYGVPHETPKPVIAPVAPIVTVHEAVKPVASVSYNYSIAHVPTPVVSTVEIPAVSTPIFVNTPSEIQIPAGLTTLYDGSIRPTLYHNLVNYAPTYPAPAVPAPVYTTPYAYSYGYNYGYGLPRPIGQQLVYNAAAPAAVSNVAVSQVVSGTPIVQEPVVTYEYQLPHVVVPEFSKPVVPHTVYGVPN